MPDSPTVIVEFAASLKIVIIPVSMPVPVGENLTEKFADWPPISVSGVAMPEIEKSLPCRPIEEITNEAWPLLLSATLLVCEVPSWTVPKVTLVG